MTDRDTALRHLREVLAVNHSPFLGSDGIRPCPCAIHEAARAALSAPSIEASGEGSLTPCPDCGHRESWHGPTDRPAAGCWAAECATRIKGKSGTKCHRGRPFATDPSHPIASDPLDIKFHDERRAEVAEMIAEGDASADDGLMGPDGLADGLLTLAEGWVRASLASHPTAEPGLPCARYFGSDGTLCSTHHGRFLSDTTMRCALAPFRGPSA